MHQEVIVVVLIKVLLVVVQENNKQKLRINNYFFLMLPIVPTSVLKVYAETIGLNNLSEDFLTSLSMEVEFRTREIIQEASKFMLNSSRGKLTIEDVNNALSIRNVERLWGLDPCEPLNFKPVPNTSIFYLPREEIDLESLISAPLPRAPQPLTLTSHWLAIDGVQPSIPENPLKPTDEVSLDTDDSGINNAAIITNIIKRHAPITEEKPDIKPLVRHILSREQQSYYDSIVKDLSTSSPSLLNAALTSLRSDSGIQPLLPYFVQFVAEMIPRNLRSLPQLIILIKVLGSLLANDNLFIEQYLHQIMPSLLSCLMGGALCANPVEEDHWSLRELCAEIIADLCSKWSKLYPSLIPRVTKTMLGCLKDGEKGMTSHYGAIIGICAIGPRAIESTILPLVENGYLLTLRDVTVEEGESTIFKERLIGAVEGAIRSWLLSSTNENSEKISFLKKMLGE